MVDLFFYRDPEETEKEEQVGFSGQNRDNQQQALESQYYDDGPSIMPSAGNFAGNQENWGASGQNWGVTAGAGAVESTEWNAPAAANTGATSW